MQLPVKEYFSLQEICSLWSVTNDDLLYYAENNLLEICARATAIIAELEQMNSENMSWEDSEGKSLRFSPQSLMLTDIYRIIKAGGNPVLVFQTKDSGMDKLSELIHNKGISLSMQDLIITRKEKIRFEQFNGISDKQLQYLSFSYSPDFREVWHYGKRHLFGPVQAKIISQLYSASKTDKPWVHAKTLLSQSGSVSTRVSAVFHGNRSWDEITYSDHKGYYRLKIPISKTPYPAQMLLEF